MTVEHDVSFWEQAFRWAWALIGGLVMIVWGMLNSKINAKASKESVDILSSEVDRQRDNIGKIFDELRDIRKEQGESHNKIMEAIHSNFPVRR